MGKLKRGKKISLILVLLSIILFLALYFISNNSRREERLTQQCKGQIVYIAKDFYSDRYILYVKLDQGYTAKEELGQFLITENSVVLMESDDYSVEEILNERMSGNYVEIYYEGNHYELEEYLWVYPVEVIAFLDLNGT